MADDAERSEPDAVAEAPRELTEEQRLRVEDLLRQANLAKVRGQADLSERLVLEAVQLAPHSSPANEALGDVYLEQRQTRKAREAYRQAVELDATNASAERKYGETVLAIETALNPALLLGSGEGTYASGKASVVLSFLVPGLGQIVNGLRAKGAAFMGVWLVGWILAFLVPNGMKGLTTLFTGRGPGFEPLVLLPLGISAIAWIWSILDAGQAAGRVEQKKFERPTPPVDKDFEI
ncbi:MAG: tetratricopeptide repeat protein [Fimbriimonadaceae bacterium]|nr:tetratricopeptide repeat protein [Fimbriimonadaceae bacterium]QYK54876.1 MAG: tetratricopeptide repeat protein [Fimbriimonadaceae bacterium]